MWAEGSGRDVDFIIQVGVVGLAWGFLSLSGWAIARAWGATSAVAWFCAVPVSWSAIGVGAWLQPASGRPAFSPGYAMLCLIVVAVLGVATRLVSRRLGGSPRVASLSDVPISPRLAFSLMAWILVASAVILFASAGWTLETPSQTWDATYHTNAARYAATSGVVNPDVVQQFVSSDTGYYPTGVLSVTTLVVQVLGVDAVVASNVSAILLAGALWPGCVIIGALLTGLVDRLSTIVATGVLSIATWGMPWAPLGWGVLWPTAAAAAYAPILVGLVLSATRGNLSIKHVVAGAAAGGASLVMHPRGVFLILLPCLVVLAWWVLSKALDRWRERRRGSALVILGIALAMSAGLALWLRRTSGAKFTAIDWPRDESLARALLSHLVAAPERTFPAIALTILLPLGLWLAVSRPRLRGIAWTWCVLVIVDAVTSSLRIDALSLATKFWYQDRFRSATMTAFPTILLAVMAVRHWWPRVVARVPGTSPSRLGYLSAVLALVFAIPQATLYLGDRYNRAGETAGRSLVSREEVAFLQSLKGVVPEGDIVLNNPADGSTFLYAYSGIKPVFYTMARGSTVPRATELLDGFNNPATVTKTCDALRGTHVRWVLDGGPSYSDRGIDPVKPTGVSIPPGFPLTTRVAASPSGGMTLYRITGCGSD